jgi:phage shock protein A
VTDEELERKMAELEVNVRRLRDEKQLLKQMLSSPVTRSYLKNRLSFYKFSGTLNNCHRRFYRVLMMVYNIQNYWIFGLCPASENPVIL